MFDHVLIDYLVTYALAGVLTNVSGDEYRFTLVVWHVVFLVLAVESPGLAVPIFPESCVKELILQRIIQHNPFMSDSMVESIPVSSIPESWIAYMPNFSVSFDGRIQNFPLPRNKPLLPLYEAVVNSIHAIEDRANEEADAPKGKIEIVIIRDNDLFDGENEAGLSAIRGFEIRDNGIGFNDDNFSSFLESDSTYKASRGGKGVGRFSWLKAFEKAEVTSVYSEGSETLKRSFEFKLGNSGIEDNVDDALADTPLETKVVLDCYKEEYRANVPRNTAAIAQGIIQHCLIYLLDEQCPNINIIDSNESICLNAVFHEVVEVPDEPETVEIDSHVFTLLNIKMKTTSVSDNKILLCANRRLVEEHKLDKYVPDIGKQLYKLNGFVYVGVLYGEYLDDNVDMTRLSFLFPEKGNNLLYELDEEKILCTVSKKAEAFLYKYLLPIREEKAERIQRYVTDTAPQYRHLVNYMSEDMARISPDATDESIDDALYVMKRKFDKSVKAENLELLEQLKNGIVDSEDYRKRFDEQVKRASEANKAALADYVSHRKVILDLLENGIRKNDDGKFNKEEYVHELIYPMRATSDDTEYETHNLWLIDERLAYSEYISSDVPFGGKAHEKRTDIMVLDNPIAVSQEKNTGRVFDSIVLFELKRPMRDDYRIDENPIDQLLEYAEKISSGNACDAGGRPIIVNATTRMYLYAVCDITASLEKIMKRQDFKVTPDGLGRYKFSDNYNAFIEVLPYDKMINDSKMRNKILFDKLGI